MDEDKFKEMQRIWGNEYAPIFGALIDSFRIRFNLSEDEYDKLCEWTEEN